MTGFPALNPKASPFDGGAFFVAKLKLLSTLEGLADVVFKLAHVIVMAVKCGK